MKKKLILIILFSSNVVLHGQDKSDTVAARVDTIRTLYKELLEVNTKDSLSSTRRDSIINVDLKKISRLITDVEKEITGKGDFYSRFVKNYIEKVRNHIGILFNVADLPWNISFIGDASLLKSNTDTKNVNANGSLGLKYVSPDHSFEAKALIIIVSSLDTIATEYGSDSTVSNSAVFGNSILDPMSGSKSIQSGYVEVRKYFYPEFLNIKAALGIEGIFSLSSRLWTDSSRIERVHVFSAAAGFFIDMLPKEVINKYDVSLKVHGRAAARILFGDIRQDAAIREKFLGDATTDFYGTELGISLAYKNLSGFVTLPFLFNGKVKGISYGGFIGGIRISTSLIDFTK